MIFASLFALLMLYGCGLVPFTRTAPRSFLLPRDYADMKRIFAIKELPPSFKLLAVKYPWGVGMTDGPPPVKYKATVSAQEFSQLMASIADTRDVPDHGYGRMAALDAFNPDILTRILESRNSLMTSATLPADKPAWYTHETIISGGYSRTSDIITDPQTSHSVDLYISTRVPYQ